MHHKIYDLMIVGQGLTGINLSFIAGQDAYECIHIHQPQAGDSTPVAAGLINPITGRRFVKSWLIDQVMPYAEQHYTQLGNYLGNSYLERMNIVRVLKRIEDENTWLSKSADPYLKDFIQDRAEVGNLNDVLRDLPESLGELKACFRIRLKQLSEDYLVHLGQKQDLIPEKFDYAALNIHDDCVEYKGHYAQYIVFAEGWRMRENPYFQEVELAPAKGELMLIHAPELQLNRAYKKDFFITPIGEDIYWVGASYEWQNYDPAISTKMQSRIESALQDMIQVPYTVIARQAGIRPSSKDRKPIIGRHKTHEKVFVFNGMGTKGSSLSPFFADQLVQHIFKGKEILADVDVKRYYK